MKKRGVNKMDNAEWFKSVFKKITGFEPFGWQIRSFENFSNGVFIPRYNIDTGLGHSQNLDSFGSI